jgi:hypothetical protein
VSTSVVGFAGGLVSLGIRYAATAPAPSTPTPRATAEAFPLGEDTLLNISSNIAECRDIRPAPMDAVLVSSPAG